MIKFKGTPVGTFLLIHVSDSITTNIFEGTLAATLPKMFLVEKNK